MPDTAVLGPSFFSGEKLVGTLEPLCTALSSCSLEACRWRLPAFYAASPARRPFPSSSASSPTTCAPSPTRAPHPSTRRSKTLGGVRRDLHHREFGGALLADLPADGFKVLDALVKLKLHRSPVTLDDAGGELRVVVAGGERSDRRDPTADGSAGGPSVDESADDDVSPSSNPTRGGTASGLRGVIPAAAAGGSFPPAGPQKPRLRTPSGGTHSASRIRRARRLAPAQVQPRGTQRDIVRQGMLHRTGAHRADCLPRVVRKRIVPALFARRSQSGSRGLRGRGGRRPRRRGEVIRARGSDPGRRREHQRTAKA